MLLSAGLLLLLLCHSYVVQGLPLAQHCSLPLVYEIAGYSLDLQMVALSQLAHREGNSCDFQVCFRNHETAELPQASQHLHTCAGKCCCMHVALLKGASCMPDVLMQR